MLAKKGQPLHRGPCSAETQEQVLATAHGLKALGKTDLFRAGI
jgi:chorismate mutase